jgi:DNA-binding LacI/PurR family transcriptional regulator
MTKTSVQTIADIARLAGVSKATVSRALNDSPLIARETKERISAIAAEHDFHMNVPARRLSLQQSHAIALVTYPFRADSEAPDVFMLEIMSGVSQALHGNDYDLLVISVEPNDLEWPRAYLESRRVDGFVLLTGMCEPRHLEALLQLGAPIVMWGVPPGSHRLCTVAGDSYVGGRVATEHLLGRGRSRIGFLGGPEQAPEVQERYRGYEAVLRDSGLEVALDLVSYGPWHFAAAATRDLLARAPDLDAIFACSDALAIAAMDELRAHGRAVPDDVAVVGYDDALIARHSNPPLTTIRQDGPLAGRLLAENLLQHLRTGVVTNVSIPAELVIREST